MYAHPCVCFCDGYTSSSTFRDPQSSICLFWVAHSWSIATVYAQHDITMPMYTDDPHMFETTKKALPSCSVTCHQFSPPLLWHPKSKACLNSYHSLLFSEEQQTSERSGVTEKHLLLWIVLWMDTTFLPKSVLLWWLMGVAETGTVPRSQV